MHFIRLKLTRGGEAVSENFYWRGLEEYNYQALRDLPKAADRGRHARSSGKAPLASDHHSAKPTKTPALMVKLKAVREKSGDRILPAIYSDNYVALMPGESRVIHTELNAADARGETPRIAIE